MKTLPTRLENAITKLYNAFHKGELDAFDCKHCAVGNICDNNDDWEESLGHSCEYDNDYILWKIEPREVYPYSYGGYSAIELHNVERIFLSSMIGQNTRLVESQFKGLCAVVEYLCSLDNIPNVMDYTKLFETNSFDSAPKYKLVEVL